jgi:hypothetical protein
VTGFGRLYGVHRQGADGVDAELVIDCLAFRQWLGHFLFSP